MILEKFDDQLFLKQVLPASYLQNPLQSSWFAQVSFAASSEETLKHVNPDAELWSGWLLLSFFHSFIELKSITLRESLSARTMTGVWIGSDESKERVMLSPGLAKAFELLALVETRVMLLRVGVVVSRTTWVLSSVTVTGEPLLPARSSTSMLKEALPV